MIYYSVVCGLETEMRSNQTLLKATTSTLWTCKDREKKDTDNQKDYHNKIRFQRLSDKVIRQWKSVITINLKEKTKYELGILGRVLVEPM